MNWRTEITSVEEISKFENVLILCPEEFLNNLILNYVKLLKLAGKPSARACGECIIEDRGIQLEISQRIQGTLWNSGNQ